MRRLSTLKTLTDIFFFMSLLVLFFGIPFILIVAFMPKRVPFEIMGDSVEGREGVELVILLIILLIAYAFWVYALYQFRKVLELFQKKNFFDERVVKHLDQIGKAIIIGLFIAVVPVFFYKVVAEAHMKLEVSLGFDSVFFILGLGLFFMALSDIFLAAKMMKEENDSTI